MVCAVRAGACWRAADGCGHCVWSWCVHDMHGGGLEVAVDVEDDEASHECNHTPGGSGIASTQSSAAEMYALLQYNRTPGGSGITSTQSFAAEMCVLLCVAGGAQAAVDASPRPCGPEGSHAQVRLWVFWGPAGNLHIDNTCLFWNQIDMGVVSIKHLDCARMPFQILPPLEP